MLGYLVIATFASLAALIFCIVTNVRVKKMCYNAKKQIKIENIYLDALKLDYCVQDINADVLSSFPAIKGYLKQSHALVATGSICFDELTVDRLASNREYMFKFLNELEIIPDYLDLLVERQAALIKKIAEIKHPISMRLSDIQLRVIFALLMITLKVIKLFHGDKHHQFPNSTYVNVSHTGMLSPH